jgi:hypothetical protein
MLTAIQNEFLQAVLVAAAVEPGAGAGAVGDVLVQKNVSQATQLPVQHINTNTVCVIQRCRGLGADWDMHAQVDAPQDDLWELIEW